MLVVFAHKGYGKTTELEASLQNREGILHSHLERGKSPVELYLHHDPNLMAWQKLNGLRNGRARKSA